METTIGLHVLLDVHRLDLERNRPCISLHIIQPLWGRHRRVVRDNGTRHIILDPTENGLAVYAVISCIWLDTEAIAVCASNGTLHRFQ